MGNGALWQDIYYFIKRDLSSSLLVSLLLCLMQMVLLSVCLAVSDVLQLDQL